MAKQAIIFSVASSKVSDKENLLRHKLAKMILKTSNVEFEDVDGVYKGSTEYSYMVGSQHEELVNDLCLATDQECYLVINLETRLAKLVYLRSNKTQKLDGKFQQVTREQALELDNFSRISSNNQYWAVV